MQNKKIIQLIFIVTLLGLFVVWRNRQPELGEDWNSYTAKTAVLNADTIEAIVIATGGAQLKLTKENQEWKINDIKADSKLVNQMIQSLVSPTTVEVIAETKARYERMGLAPKPQAEVTLSSGTMTQNFLIGNRQSDGHYVKFGDEDRVYLITALPDETTETSVDEWIDLTILSIPRDSINQIDLSSKYGEVNLVQETGNWHLKEDKAIINKDNLEQILGPLESLVALGAADSPKATLDTRRPDLTMTIQHNSTQETVLRWYATDDGYDLTVSHLPTAYRLTKSTTENFMLSRSDLGI